MKNIIKRLPIFLCFCVICVCIFPQTAVNSKTETKEEQLLTKTLEGNIGPVTGTGKTILIQNEVEQIKKGAKYSFVSSNTSVVKVDSKTGVLEGITPGTANISVKKTYNGKTSVVGICKVTIREASIGGEKKVAVGRFTITGKNENPKAVYTYESEDSSIVAVGNEKTVLTAQKEGSTVVTVYENYKNRTRKIGNATIHVSGAAVNQKLPSIVLATGQSKMFSCADYLDYINAKAEYGLTTKDTGILKVSQAANGTYKVEGVKAGTGRLIFTEKVGKKTQNVGLLTIAVKDSIACKDIYFDENFTSVFADIPGETPYTITIYMIEGESMELSEMTHLDPSNTTERLTYASGNTEILHIDEKTGTMTALKEGTAEFTLRCGTHVQTGMVNIVSKGADIEIQKMASETVKSIQALTKLPIQKGQLTKVYNERVKVYRQISALEKAFYNDDIPAGMSMAVLLPNEKEFDDYSKKLMTAIHAETSLFQNKKSSKNSLQVIPNITKISGIKEETISCTWEKSCNTADILYALYANAPSELYRSGMKLTLPMQIHLTDRGHYYTNAVMTLKNGEKTGTIVPAEPLVKENYAVSCKESRIFADKTAEKSFSRR